MRDSCECTGKIVSGIFIEMTPWNEVHRNMKWRITYNSTHTLLTGNVVAGAKLQYKLWILCAVLKMKLVAVERSRLLLLVLRFGVIVVVVIVSGGGVCRRGDGRGGIPLLQLKRLCRYCRPAVICVSSEVRRRRRVIVIVVVERRYGPDGLPEELLFGPGLWVRRRRAVRVHDDALFVQRLRRRRVRGGRVVWRWWWRQRSRSCGRVVRRRVVLRRLDGILRLVRVLLQGRTVRRTTPRHQHHAGRCGGDRWVRVRVRGIRVRVRIRVTGTAGRGAYGHVVLCLRNVRLVLARARRRACCTRFLK